MPQANGIARLIDVLEEGQGAWISWIPVNGHFRNLSWRYLTYIYIYIYLSIYLSIYLDIYISIYQAPIFQAYVSEYPN